MIGNLLRAISDFIWGPATIILLVGTGIFLTIRLGFIQFRQFGHAVDLVLGKYDKADDPGEISHFEALSAALSATIGTGNIAGVATAIALGGPGAVFWMWITALFGMATKFTSCLLSLKYRTFHLDGTVSGGPMYFLEKGLGSKLLGYIFAACTAAAALGIGNMVQSNSVAQAINHTFQVPKIYTGLIIAFAVWVVIIGGIKRIAHVASKIVPFMSIVYILGALIILLLNFQSIPDAFYLIFKHAFNATSAAGGFIGSTVALTIRMGVARGLFSNEAGLGSAPMAHAAAKTKEPVREGLVAMLGPFIDTIVICSMTALVIIVTGMWKSGMTGTALTSQAFETSLPGIGNYIVTFGIVFFAYSTIITWGYYGERGIEYVLGGRSILPYRWVYTLAIPLGAFARLQTVWSAADISNGLMIFPNLIGLLGLSGIAAAAVKKYLGHKSEP